MDKYKGIRQLANEIITIRTPTSETDTSLIERAQRLISNVELICRQPEVAGMDLIIDRLCLYAATYFSDSGLAQYLQKTNAPVTLGAGDYDRRELEELSADIVRRNLGHVLDSSELENTVTIIRQSNERFTSKAEAMILSDARNLEDMGMVGVFYENIRYACQGKGLEFLLQSWQKKIDYRYWQARLKDSFRFESVRQVAKKRLENATAAMNWLKTECESLDLRENIAERTTV